MKKIAFTLCLAVFCSGLMAQTGLRIGSLKVKKIGVFLGQDQDLLSSMDYAYFLNASKTEVSDHYSNMGLAQTDVYSMVCENPHLRISATLVPTSWSKSEIRASLNGIFNRVDGVSYRSQDWDWFTGKGDYIDFNTYAHEVGAEVAVIRRIPLMAYRNKFGDSPINFYLGGGTNAGYTFGHQLYINGHNYSDRPARASDGTTFRDGFENEWVAPNYFYESYELRNGFQQRVFGQAGIGFTILRRIEIGVEGRYGYGYRAIAGAPIKTTNLRSLGLFANYVFQ